MRLAKAFARATVDDRQSSRPLAVTMRPVAVVVGAGVNGLTCAVRLLEAGARVCEELALPLPARACPSPDWPRLCRVGRALHLQGQAREDRVAGRGRNLGVSPGVLCCHTGDLCSLGTHLSHASVLPRFSTRWSRRRRPSGGACLAPLALAAPVPDAPTFQGACHARRLRRTRPGGGAHGRVYTTRALPVQRQWRGAGRRGGG